MPALLSLVGKRFGRLLVIERDMEVSPAKGAYWRCRCDCGNYTVVSRGNLLNGSTRSCRCIRDIQGGFSYKHPLWKRWQNMVERCTSQKCKDFVNYGARGISVCERWRSFENFLADMGDGFSPGMTIDRVDTNGNYEPANCRWASPLVQSRNKRRSVIIDTPLGRMNVSEAAERFGINRASLRGRIKRGWPTETIFDNRKFHKSNPGRLAKST